MHKLSQLLAYCRTQRSHLTSRFAAVFALHQRLRLRQRTKHDDQTQGCAGTAQQGAEKAEIHRHGSSRLFGMGLL